MRLPRSNEKEGTEMELDANKIKKQCEEWLEKDWKDIENQVAGRVRIDAKTKLLLRSVYKLGYLRGAEQNTE